MISMYYSELSFQEKLTLILTASFNDILSKLSSHIISRIVFVERTKENLECYIWQNGDEVETWNIHLDRNIEYTEEEILHKIEHNLVQLAEDEDDPRAPLMPAKKLCHCIYTISSNEFYIIPVSGKATPPEGIFFQEVYSSFIREWREILLNMDEYKLLDYPDYNAAANDNISTQDCIYNACARILAKAGFPGGVGDPYETQITVSILNDLAQATYERRGIHGTVVAISDSMGITNIDLYLDIHFMESFEFDYGNQKVLRKLAEMSTEDIAIVVYHDKFIGLSDRHKFDWYIRFNGNGGWNLYKGEKKNSYRE